MKLGIVGGGILFLAGCASTPSDNTAAIDRACSVADCFNERDIRSFEVIDRETLVVYTGSQRCAFKVELTGTFCDMTFAPELYFRSPTDILQDDRRSRSAVFGSDLDDRDLRVCANDLRISVDGGAFTEGRSGNNSTGVFRSDQRATEGQARTGPNDSAPGTDRFGQSRSQCQVSDVSSLTDDQLVELYVARGLVPPPPPMGSGEIEIGEQEPPADPAAPAEEEAAAAPQANIDHAPAVTAVAAANVGN